MSEETLWIEICELFWKAYQYGGNLISSRFCFLYGKEAHLRLQRQSRLAVIGAKVCQDR